VALCADGEEALAEIKRHRPQLALLDQRLEGLYTLELVRKIRGEGIPTQMVVMGVQILHCQT